MKNIIVDMCDHNAARHFSETLQEIGFAVLMNHPIEKSEIEYTYNEWKKFFSSEEKFQYIRSKTDGEGYVPLEIENAKNFTIPDLKEFYHFYKWGRQPKNIDTTSTIKLYDSFIELGIKLLGWLDEAIPKNISSQLSMPLCDMVKNSNRHLLRLLHYPPIKKDCLGMRSAPHTDLNLLTLLPVSTASGLELRDKNGIWRPVSYTRDSIIVNTADMLDLCTSGYYQSVTHRVINPMHSKDNKSRYAAPFFIHPRQDVILTEGLTAREYWIQRLKEIGLYYDFLCIDRENSGVVEHVKKPR